MKKLLLIILMNFLLVSCFAKGLGIKILTNPFFPIYDIAYAFADEYPETFQIITDLEVQIPIAADFDLSIYQKLSFDKYFESYCVKNDGSFDAKKALQFEYFIEPGITYNFTTSQNNQSAPFITAFPVIGIVDVHSKPNRADFFMLGAGVTGGYQWNFSSDFVLKLYAGLSKTWTINILKSDFYNDVENYSLFGLPFDLRFGCRIGIKV